MRYTDLVVDDLDVLARHIEITPDAGFTPSALRLVYFENFSPTLEKIDFFPNDETNLLANRDYALGMSARLNALVHFSVEGRPADLVAPLGTAPSPAAVDTFLNGVATQKGMWILVGGDRAARRISVRLGCRRHHRRPPTPTAMP